MPTAWSSTTKTLENCLNLVDSLISDDTIVIYTTDNGPNQFSWPDAATTPFRSEKNTNWEGAFRVPAMIRWPGHIKPQSSTDIIVGASTGFRHCLPQPAIPTLRIIC